MDTNNKKLVPVTVTVDPEEASSIFNAYDTLRAALFFYLKKSTYRREPSTTSPSSTTTSPPFAMESSAKSYKNNP